MTIQFISIHNSMLSHRRGVKHLAIMERELTGRTTRDFVLSVVTDRDPSLQELRNNLNEKDARAILAQDSADLMTIAKQGSNGIIPHCGEFYELIECLKLRGGALGSALSAIKRELAPGPIYMEATSLITVIESTAALFEPGFVYPLLLDLINVAQRAGIANIQVTERNMGNISETLLKETWEITSLFLKLHHGGRIAKYVNCLACYYWNLLVLLPSNAELLYPDLDPEESADDNELSLSEPEESAESEPGESANNELSLSEPEEYADSYYGSSSNEDSNGDPQERAEIPGQSIDLIVLSRFITRLIQKHRAETAESSREAREGGVNETENLDFNVTGFSPFEPAKYIYLIYWVVNRWEYLLILIVFVIVFYLLLKFIKGKMGRFGSPFSLSRRGDVRPR